MKLHCKGECGSSCLNSGVMSRRTSECFTQYSTQRFRQCIVRPLYVIHSNTSKVPVRAVGMNTFENSANSSGNFRCNFATDPQCDSAWFSQALGKPGGKRTAVHAEKESAILEQSMGRVHQCTADCNNTASGKRARPPEQGCRMLKAISSAWSGKPFAGRN